MYADAIFTSENTCRFSTGGSSTNKTLSEAFSLFIVRLFLSPSGRRRIVRFLVNRRHRTVPVDDL